MSTVASATWRALDQELPDKPLPKGLDAVWDAGRGLIVRSLPRRYAFLRRAKKIIARERDYQDMTSERLHEAASTMRDLFRRGRDTPPDLERAFALVREVAVRQLGEKPYRTQVAGALALHGGCIAEMATGEGKTLAATMPAVVAGWRGRGCHIVTVNDYLAQRDAEWMGRIYHFCGLKVAYIQQGMEPAQRRKAYLADVTYCTNKEVAADFLRDRLVLGHIRGSTAAITADLAPGGPRLTDSLVQRGLHYAIVDEADSILIDEAVTPLIISGPAPNSDQMQVFRQAAQLAAVLKQATDYHVSPRDREIKLTKRGKARSAEAAGHLGGIWEGARRREEILTKALIAKELYTRGVQYVVEDDKVVIVDEFTGRLMPDRTWRDELHQAVEAKENITITPPKDTYARISFQRFFRLYRRLSGMTGTAREAAAEFWQIYHVPVTVMPTHRPCVRRYLPDIVSTTTSVKWQRIVEEICRIHQTGRPILVGTRTVHASEHLSQLLNAKGLSHQVLNAVRHREEARIVAQAGQIGRITVATNMAGRGTDIRLAEGVAALGGLHVIAAEHNEFARIDRQLFGRCARQGDPGSVQAIVSLDDEFVQRYAGNQVVMLRRLRGGTNKSTSSVLAQAVFRAAQKRAEKVALSRRKAVMRMDHWLDEHLGFMQ